jgi:hypothetical protein
MLGKMIKSDAYTKDYDVRNGVLVKPLPSCSQTMEDNGVAEEAKFQIDLIENQPLLQIFSFKKEKNAILLMK